MFILNTLGWLEPIITPVLVALGTALAGLLGNLIFKAAAWINRKTGNEQVANAIDRVALVVNAAVKSINQSFVDQLKKDGKFDKEAQEKAAREAFNLTLGLLTDEIKDIIEENFGSLEKYLKAIIEATVASSKVH